MTKIVVDIPSTEPYDVRVASDGIASLGITLRSIEKNPQVLVITDSEVERLYMDRMLETLELAQYEPVVITVSSGEEAKSVEVLSEIWNAMAEAGLNRDSLVIAYGGGVVGDLAGFAAATFMRGLPLVQVPTTLLSMVDSSVGGKTAVNLPQGKNLVGSFYQPKYVCADLSVLETLPQREWACGCAEVAKSAAVDSDDFFFWLASHANEMRERDLAVVEEAVVRSVVFKANVVAEDQCETKGVRECLNYGHTLAHAIETAAGYGVYSHGHAVAQGMRFAARLGAELVGTPLDFIQAQDDLLDALVLPEITQPFDPEQLLEHMKSDKKARSGELRFVLPLDVGKWELRAVDESIVLRHLQAWQNSLAQK